MVRKRLVPSLQAAFTQYLGRGGLAYIDRVRLSPEEAFESIRDMGGVVVMAHPGVIERENPGVLERALDCLMGLGLDGIEARYSRHTPEQTAKYIALADRHSLLTTGGSDFHSPSPEKIEIGRGFGTLSVPYESFAALKKAVEAKRTANLPA
jgi:predicted metal-dependent phosphoesterase TrpH